MESCFIKTVRQLENHSDSLAGQMDFGEERQHLLDRLLDAVKQVNCLLLSRTRKAVLPIKLGMICFIINCRKYIRKC